MGLTSSEPETLPDPATTRKVDDLRALLGALELQLANPAQAAAMAACYSRLSDWTRDHAEDPELQTILARLEPEAMYPEWRRRALEDAYVLFYEDIARSGGSGALKTLPPPPVSYGTLLRERQAAPALAGSFESGSRYWHSERFDYEIRETGQFAVMPGPQMDDTNPRDRSQTMSKGREIVSKGRSARYCACASDPVCGFVAYASGYGHDLDVPPTVEQRPVESLGDNWDRFSQATDDSVGVVQRSPRLKPMPTGSNRSLDNSGSGRAMFPAPLLASDPFAPDSPQLRHNG